MWKHFVNGNLKSRRCLPKWSLFSSALGAKSSQKVMITPVPAISDFYGEMTAEVYEKEKL